MDMKEIRDKIDMLDDTIISAFEERMALCAMMAKYKKENGIPVFHPEREKAIIDRLTKDADEPMVEYITALYKTLFEISRAYQTKRIANM